MEVKNTQRNAPSKREHSKGRKSTNAGKNLFEEMTKANSLGNVSCTTNEDGVMRMKIVVRKQDFKALLQVMENGEIKNIDHVSSLPLKGHSNHFCRKHLLKRKYAFKEGSKWSWYPELQSIPEEL